MKSIKFNNEMAAAILLGYKTQTRRPVEFDMPKYTNKKYTNGTRYRYDGLCEGVPFLEEMSPLNVPTEHYIEIELPPTYEINDILKVYETNGIRHKDMTIYIKIINIYIEKLSCMSFKDCANELGMSCDCKNYAFDERHMIRDLFYDLWGSIYESIEYKAYKNPWVWVYEFERIVKPQ